ncbi:MAG TPA: ferrous iron transport protein B [bacterium]|nr:ferrous iron transport protein B [bacterium]
MAKKTISLALAGNPNSGKTTIFNNLTGARQHVGNYPGVTVEKKEGAARFQGQTLNVVDLPGTYSLTAYSIEELVTRDFIISERPDVVIDVVDASNLERNLYLAVQLIELGVPLVLAFNMSDVAKQRGFKFDLELLSRLFGCPIVPTVGHRKEGMDRLLQVAIEVTTESAKYQPARIRYGKEINEELTKIQSLVEGDEGFSGKLKPRWAALKLLEDDKAVWEKVGSEALRAAAQKSIHHLEVVLGDHPEMVIAERRYGFISGACQEAVRATVEARHTMSDRIDSVVTNRILGLPIFLVLMWLMFKFTFVASEPLVGWVEAGFGLLGGVVGRVLEEGTILHSLVVDGAIGGVGNVLMFVPIILLLFLFMALLEDSGYMARAAFIMDRIMHKIGLHGQSFIPMLLGFGCNVPAIMATRVIASRKDRFVTILVNPFMSCGARLPIYTLFIGVFFAESAGTVLFSLYILGMLVAMLSAKLFRRYLLRGPTSPFVMELPPYRMPTLRGALLHTWERGWLYIKKAGTVVLMGSVAIWFISSFPSPPEYSKDYEALMEQAGQRLGEGEAADETVEQLEAEMQAEKLAKSYAGTLGKAIEPLIKPLGFDWRIGVGLFGGFVAKEIVVSTLGTLYSISDADEESQSLREQVQNAMWPDGRKVYSPLVAFALMVFCLLYVPCLVTLAVIRKETNSWRWPLFTAAYTTAVAWVASFIVYQVGSVFGVGVG